DRGEAIERRVPDAVVMDDRVERAALADMAELDAVDVVWRGALLFRDREHLVHRHVDELGFRIDEARDQPRAGDAVDLWALARHPLVVPGSQLLARRQGVLGPARDAAVEMDGVDARGTQRRRGSLTDLVSVHAVGHDRAAGRQILRPAADLLGRAMDRAGDHLVVGAECIRTPDVDHQRGRRGAETLMKIVWRNRAGLSVHGAISSKHRALRSAWTTSV